MSVFLIYLTAFSMIVDMYTVRSCANNVYRMICNNLPIVTIPVIIAITPARINLKIKPHTLGFILYLFSILLVSLSRDCDLISLTLKILIVIILEYYVSFFDSYNKLSLFEALRNLIYALAILSLTMWVFGTLLNIVQYTNIINIQWGIVRPYKSYFGIYYEESVANLSTLFGFRIVANIAIFPERGFTAFVFSTALLYELFLEKEPRNSRIIVLFIALISTFSTTAIIVGLFIVLFYILSSKPHRVMLKVFKCVSIPLIAYIALQVTFIILDEKQYTTTSYSSRLTDFQNGFKCWMDSFLIGHGYNNSTISQIWHTGYSNSFSQIVSQGGFAFFLLYLLGFLVPVIRAFRNRDRRFISFLAIYLVLFVVNAVAFRNISLYTLLFLLFSSKEKTELELDTNDSCFNEVLT